MSLSLSHVKGQSQGLPRPAAPAHQIASLQSSQLNQARHYIARTSRAQPRRIWPDIACKVQTGNALPGTQGHCRAQYAACCFVKHAMTLDCKLPQCLPLQVTAGPALQGTSVYCYALAFLVSNLQAPNHSLTVMSCLPCPTQPSPGYVSSLTRQMPCAYKPAFGSSAGP